MPISWTNYDAFAWPDSAQAPLGATGRDDIERLAADILGISDGDRARSWGTASPPGRYAATVVRVDPAIDHRFATAARDRGIAVVGLKVLKTTRDAQREGDRLIAFHGDQLPRFPSLPQAHLQVSIAAGRHAGRTFAALQWIEGATLDQLAGEAGSLAPSLRATIVRQLFRDIVIPCWSAGVVWWDVRAANYCFSMEAQHLAMIDIDSLAAYAEEILDAPDVWTRREKGRGVALARLRQMSLRFLPGARARKTALAAWTQHLAPSLMHLGRRAHAEDAANAALDRYLAAWSSNG